MLAPYRSKIIPWSMQAMQCSSIRTAIPVTEAMLENMPFRRPSVSIDDISTLSSQLGFPPYNVVDIAARDASGKPIVAFLYGLTTEKRKAKGSGSVLETFRIPFPTIYWLTCPDLKARISKLEQAGFARKLQGRLNSDPEHIAAMQRAHELYAEERKSTLRQRDLDFLAGNKSFDEYHAFGISGMRNTNFRAVKCLHTHYAHYMGCPSHGNCIGKWVSDLLAMNG